VLGFAAMPLAPGYVWHLSHSSWFCKVSILFFYSSSNANMKESRAADFVQLQVLYGFFLTAPVFVRFLFARLMQT